MTGASEDLHRLLDTLASTHPGAVAEAFADPATAEAAEALIEERDDPLAAWEINWPDLFNAEDTFDDEWLFEPLLARGRNHAIFAEAKQGKSFILLRICVALATGEAFLNMPAGEPIDVMYLDYEMTLDDLRDRIINDFGIGPDVDLSHLHYIHIPDIPDLDTREGGQAVLAGALARNAQLVVIDTLGRTISGDENDNKVIQNVYKFTLSPLKVRGITVVRLDHAGKDIAKGQRGASGKNDDVDIVWAQRRTDNGSSYTATHARMSWVPKIVDIASKQDAAGVWQFSMAPKSIPSGTGPLVDKLDQLGVPMDMSRRKIKTTYGDQIGSYRNDVWGAAIAHRREVAEANELKNLGKVVRDHSLPTPRDPSQSEAGTTRGPLTETPVNIEGTTRGPSGTTPVGLSASGGPRVSPYVVGDHETAAEPQPETKEDPMSILFPNDVAAA